MTDTNTNVQDVQEEKTDTATPVAATEDATAAPVVTDEPANEAAVSDASTVSTEETKVEETKAE